MARGDPAKKLEYLPPYFRGGRFAAFAFSRRAESEGRSSDELQAYVRMVDRYLEAVNETLRLRAKNLGEQQ